MLYQDKMYENLINASNGAASRSRLVFLSMTLAGIVLLLIQGTSMFSWINNRVDINDRFDALYHDAKHQTKINDGDSEAFKDKQDYFHNKRQQLDDVMTKDLDIITVPALGIKFAVYDIDIITILSMLLFTFWYFFCVRRENHILKAILHECNYLFSNGLLRRTYIYRYLYNSVIHHYVFLTATTYDTAKGKKRNLMRTISRVGNYIPCIVSAFIFLTDMISLYQETPYALIPKRSAPLYSVLNFDEITIIFLRSILSVLFIFYFYFVCKDISELEKSSEEMLRKMEKLAERKIY